MEKFKTAPYKRKNNLPLFSPPASTLLTCVWSLKNLNFFHYIHQSLYTVDSAHL